jgi:hypothetical protein
MPDTLTADPILTMLQAKEWGNINDDQTAIRLINVVSEKFKVYTQRSRITEGSVDEYVHPLDGNTAFTFARPIAVALVTVIEYTRSQDETTYTETDSDLFVDRVRGRIYKTGSAWAIGTGFPSLRLQYEGGWAVIPADVVAGALAQMKIEQERLKGTVGYESITTAGDTASPDRDNVIKEAAEAWKPYRIMAR